MEQSRFHIFEFCIHNPVKVAVGVILVWIFGLLALWRIPVQLTPEVTQPVISIRTEWSGASPEEIEKEIITPQEEQLQDIPGTIDFRATCSDSFAEIEMEFEVGTDMSATLLKVGNRLDQVRQYPEDADEPTIRSVGVNSSRIAWFSLMPAPPQRDEVEAFIAKHPDMRGALEGVLAKDEIDVVKIYELSQKHPELEELIVGNCDPMELKIFAEDVISAELERVPGVADADVYGGSDVEMRVIIDPVRLAARHLSILDVRESLAAENKNVSGGDIWEGKRRNVIRTLGRFDAPEQVADVVLAYRDGAPVYVKDVAEVRLDHSKSTGVGHQRGVRMLSIGVARDQGANVLTVMAGVKAKTKILNDGILAANKLYLFQSYDETVYIDSATKLVEWNIVIGGALTVFVLLAFLRHIRSTLIVTLSIPISVIGTFMVIWLLGRSINVVSLAGMSFAVGMVVDAAVVVLENIFSHYQRGDDPFTAASRGVSEVWGAILASTLTTVAVFLPVVFIEEAAGQLFRDIAIAISVGVCLSLLVSLTVIPTAASRLLARDRASHGAVHALPGSKGRTARWGKSFVDRIVRTSERLVRGRITNLELALAVLLFSAGVAMLVPRSWVSVSVWPWSYPIFSFAALLAGTVGCVVFALVAMRYRRLGVAMTAIVLPIGLSWAIMPSADYLPEGNKNLVFASLQPPPGYNLDQLTELARRIEDRLRPFWEVEPGSPKEAALDGPAIESVFLIARTRGMFLGARAVDESRAAEMVPVITRATSDLPGVRSFVNQSSLFERGLSGGRTIDIEISGPDLNRLIELGHEVMARVAEEFPAETTETAVQPVPSLDLGSPELHVHRNVEKAAQRGINTSDLGYIVDALVDGAYSGTFWHHGKEINLVIYGQDRFSERTQNVEQLPLVTPTGDLVRLADIADVTDAAGPEQIVRVDRQRAITIRVRPGPGIALEDATTRIDEEILGPIRDRGDLGGLYQFTLAGTADDLAQMRSAMAGSLLLALVITYLLIAALYESFLYPVVIMISVPLASVGGFVGLRMLNFFTPQRLDILTMLGFVILIGTVVNNAILIVDHALQLIRNRGGNHYDAVAESVRGRVRPIFMTTLTTVLGMSPLVLLPGAGSELYRGLGVVVLSGLLVSTVFTLFLVPMLFGLVYEARELALVRMSAGLFRRRRQDDAEPDDRRRGEGDVASELASATTNGSSSPSGTAQDLTHFSAGPDAG
jgi:HAE1 family hydrophobic/amphiphilic exporter-1